MSLKRRRGTFLCRGGILHKALYIKYFFARIITLLYSAARRAHAEGHAQKKFLLFANKTGDEFVIYVKAPPKREKDPYGKITDKENLL